MLVLDEPAFHPPAVWPEVLRPTLGARHGRALFIGTFLEKTSHFYQLYEKAATLPEWGRLRIPASASGILSAQELASAKAQMTEEQYAREYELEPLLITEASIYGKLMAQAWKDQRIGHVGHDSRYDVHTAWDWGRRDLTVCWFFQMVGPAYHLIDYFADSGLTVPGYLDMLKEKKREHGYSYGTHLGPHDTDQRTIHAESSIAEEAAERGVDFTVVPRGTVAAGINRVREILPRCWFDETKCAEGIAALEQYKYTWSADLGVFSKEPEHSKHSHAADAFRVLASGDVDADDLEADGAPTVLNFSPFTYDKAGGETQLR
jgi:hypothetical protein